MNSDLTSFAELAPAFPELLLAIGAIVLLMVGVFTSSKSSNQIVLGIAWRFWRLPHCLRWRIQLMACCSTAHLFKTHLRAS